MQKRNSAVCKKNFGLGPSVYKKNLGLQQPHVKKTNGLDQPYINKIWPWPSPRCKRGSQIEPRVRPSTIRLRPSAFRLRPSTLRLCPSAPKLRLSKSGLPQHAQTAPQDTQTVAQHAQTASQDAQTAPEQAQSKGEPLYSASYSLSCVACPSSARCGERLPFCLQRSFSNLSPVLPNLPLQEMVREAPRLQHQLTFTLHAVALPCF